MITGAFEQINDREQITPSKGNIMSNSVPRNSMIKGYIGGKNRKAYSDEKLSLGCLCQCECPDHLERLDGTRSNAVGGYVLLSFWVDCM